MPARPLTIGVHESGLARAQAEFVAQRLAELKPRFSVHLEILQDEAPTSASLHDDHIAENRSKIQRLHALLREEAFDVVIHRGFDMRGNIPEDLELAAVLQRSNPFDALLSPRDVSLDELEPGSRVGVVHLRMQAQLMSYRPDLQWELITGDVGSWLTAMIDGRVDALVAPGAALEQLVLQERVCELFPPDLLVPGPGSGVLLCLVRASDERSLNRLRALHHPPTAREYAAECAFMEALGGPWEFPIGVLAQCLGDRIAMTALVASADGSAVVREEHLSRDRDPTVAGSQLAALLLQAGAEPLLHDVTGIGSASEAELIELAGLLFGESTDEVLDEEPPDPEDDDPQEGDWP
jgi:hydroxymethylbilane synthase